MRNGLRYCLFALVVALAVSLASAQTTSGVVRGTLKDDSGAVIPNATVRLSGNGLEKTATTATDGSYVFSGLAPGNYTVRVVFTGFATFEGTATVTAGRTVQVPIQLKVSAEKQEVTVQAEAGPTVSTEPDNNAGALVLRGEDLDALPDDPDDLASDLQALAGPSAGPNGGQIFIDGFSGGQLPPKETIREIRINQNPFSAEYDRLGFGRIEILTKPGTDKFRGTAFFNGSNGVWNSRNPLATNKPDFFSRMYGGNFSGPLSKRASFFVDFEKRDIDDNAVISATVLNDQLQPTPFNQALVTPQRRTDISPRLDYQLSQNHTLVFRYAYMTSTQENAGIGTFSLPSRAYDVYNDHHNFQVTETAVLNSRMVDETRLQYTRTYVNQNGDNTIPTVNVLQSFTGGGAQIGNSYNQTNHFELQNYMSVSASRQTVRFGVRLRRDTMADNSPQNFGGTFTFAGGVLAPVLDASNQPVLDGSGQPVVTRIDSLEQYRRTLLFQEQGLSAAQIRVLGGGATQFTRAGNSNGDNNALLDVSQVDVGAFVQDDWRVKPNFTLSLGLRYETQTNIHDWHDIAPRLGFAWAPGARGKQGRGKVVVRGGFGIFYDRVAENLTLQALRFNGVNQLSYIVQNPNFFPTVPPLDALGGAQAPLTVRELVDDIRAPYVMQTAISVERQLPWNTTIATTFTNSHALHQLLNRNINAPLPETYNAALPGTGVLPYGNIGNIFLYESAGLMNQNQWITNVNSRLNRNISLFSFFTLAYAHSNTDGSGSSPANPYNIAADYGRAAIDTRARFVLGGSMVAPWALRFSPFIIARTGNPFDITTGRDLNGDTQFDDRPAFATDLTRSSVVKTAYGNFDTNPLPGLPVIPRNYAEGPSSFTVNLRVSRTFGFGASRNQAAANRDGGFGGGPGGDHGPGGGRGGYGGGGRGGPGGGGGMRMGGGGMRGMFGDGGNGEHRYNLTVSVSARNLFNHVNLGQPIGNLSSPQFGQSNTLAGGFGPGGSTANNRRLDMQVRFTF